MAQIRNIFVCQSCGQATTKWSGKCPNCGAWNSLVEDAISGEDFKNIEKAEPAIPQNANVKITHKHIPTEIGEVDLVMGGGVSSGALTLLAGNPGIGKSTLALQIASGVQGKVLVISAEESAEQVIARLHRLKLKTANIQVVGETDFEVVMSTLQTQKPTLAIIDSAQTLYSSQASGLAGNPTQTKHITEQLLHFTKKAETAIVLIGHVTKDGGIAGPRTLEHLVDAVFMLEGDRYQQLRMFRGIKNRFGSTNEVGVLEMTELGLKEVKNPSEIFLEGRHPKSIGSVITATLEGARTFLFEIQALTTSTSFGYPKRTTSGISANRLDIIIAVLQKYCGLKLQNDDVFVNVVGGIKIDERASDLAVAIAIASSKTKQPISDKVILLGEVGLSGELRPVQYLEKRLKEAEKIGFTEAIVPHSSAKPKTKLKLSEYSTVAEVIKKILK